MMSIHVPGSLSACLFGAVCLLAPALLEAATTGKQPTARDMFYEVDEPQPGVAKAGTGEAEPAPRPATLGLRYAILLKRGPIGQWAEVNPDSVFHSGDRIRISVTSNAAGYLHVIHRGSSGTWMRLYPATGDGLDVPQIEAGKSVTIPAKGSFVFNNQTGTEALFLVFSREPISRLPEVIPELKSPDALLDDTSVDAIRKAYSRDLVLDFLDESLAQALNDHGVYAAKVQPERAKDPLVMDLRLTHQ
jgi:hypothetical protein